MAKLTFCFLAALLLAACNNDAKVASSTETDSSNASTSSVSLPYSVPVQPDWEIGSPENVAIAMTALKSYEMNDSAAMTKVIADSIDFYYDGGQFKGTRDSFMAMLAQHRNGFNNVSIKVHDYESVKSKKRNEEWVGLWYTETSTNKDGKVDSVMTMDDVKIVNGKVRLIDTKTRHLAPTKN